MFGAFCEKCMKLVEYDVSYEDVKEEYKGVKISYKEPRLHCKDCKSLVSDNWVMSEILKNRSDSYRKEVGLITHDDIKKILLKYKIGKKPLSFVMGWGEVTVTRYLEHDEPTKAYSDQLYKVLNDPSYYEELLESNKNRLKTCTYKATRKALDEVLSESYDDSKTLDKLDVIIRYIKKKLVYVTPNTLSNILFLCDINNMMFYCKYLIDDKIKIDNYIPKYDVVEKKLMPYKNGYVKFKTDSLDSLDMLSDDEKEVIDEIINDIGCYNEFIITKIIKMETKAFISNNKNNISKDSAKEYYSESYNNFNIINIYDYKRYANDLYMKVKNINVIE